MLHNIYIRFDTKLYRQITGIPMGTYCAPLVEGSRYLACNDNMLSSGLKNIKSTNHGLPNRFVKLSSLCWIIFILDLILNYTDKLQVF